MSILQILSCIGLIILLLNTGLYFIGFTRNGKAYKSFFFYLLFILLLQIIMQAHALLNKNNHYLSTYYLFFNFIFLSIFFYYLFYNIRAKVSSVIKYSGLAILSGLCVQYILNPQLYYNFNSVGFLITYSLLIVYSVIYLLELVSKKMTFTYIIVGMLVYFISSSLIFATATSIVSFDNEVNMLIWKINAVLFILYQLLILLEWIQAFYKKAPVREQ